MPSNHLIFLSSPSPPSFNLSQHQGLSQWASSSHEVAKVLEPQLQHQSFQWIFGIDFLYRWLVWFPCSPRDSQESSLTPQFKSISSLVLSFLYDPTLTSMHDCWKNHSFDYMDFCWQRLLRVPWTARRSNQSVLKETSPEYSLEGLKLKLKLQYFGHLMWRADSLEKTLMLGKIEGGRKRGQQRMRWLDGITNSVNMSLRSSRRWWWTGKPGVLKSMGLQRVGHNWTESDTTEQESDMTELNWTVTNVCKSWKK